MTDASPVRFREGEMLPGRLELPHSINTGGWSNLVIPIATVANGTGPTVLLLGALHLVRGDEAKPLGRPWLPLAVSIAVGGVLVYGTLGLPAFSDPEAPIHKHVAPRYINESLKETGVPNVVTAVLASYRGYDTLGETTVVFTAGIGVIALLRQRKRKDRDRR